MDKLNQKNTEVYKREWLSNSRLWSILDINKVKRVKERLAKLWRQRNTK